MDDNYRHELEALERLAQAEEAERQRVTTDNEWTTRDFAALRVDYALLSEQNARLLAFVEKWSNYDIWDLPTIGGFSDYDLGRSEILGYVSSEAAALLSELSGKSGVTNGE